MKKIYVLVGDPNNDTEKLSLNTMLAREYEKTALEAGHQVRFTHLADLQFDSVLHKGYRAIQALEPDLVKVQEDMKWADHIVILFPVWWASTPSLLKGLFDRLWLPGFAFHFKKKGLKRTDHWICELGGRSSRIIQTSGTSKWMILRKFGNPSHVLRKGILGFAGIGPNRVTWFGSVNCASPERVEKWKAIVRALAAKAR